MDFVETSVSSRCLCKAPGVSNCPWQRSASASRLLVHGVEGAPDDEAADLAGARADLVQLRVAQEAPGGVVVDVAVTSCGEGRGQTGVGGRGGADGDLLALTQTLDAIQSNLSGVLSAVQDDPSAVLGQEQEVFGTGSSEDDGLGPPPTPTLSPWH